MPYIKIVSNDTVELGGEVITEQMANEGWFFYGGPVPTANNDQNHRYNANTNQLEVITTPIAPLTMVERHKQYLSDTDHKMYTDYEAKAGEDLAAIKAARSASRAYIRANDTTKNSPVPETPNPANVIVLSASDVDPNTGLPISDLAKQLFANAANTANSAS